MLGGILSRLCRCLAVGPTEGVAPAHPVGRAVGAAVDEGGRCGAARTATQRGRVGAVRG